jgi:hypothetical protein
MDREVEDGGLKMENGKLRVEDGRFVLIMS